MSILLLLVLKVQDECQTVYQMPHFFTSDVWEANWILSQLKKKAPYL